MNIIIIGSGISGLTAACALAEAGHKVTVYEQAAQVGGVTASFEKEGFRWDLGQLLVEGFGPGEPAGDVLAGLGLAEAVPLRPDDRGYVFPDFEIKRPAEFSDPLWRIQRLKEIFPAEKRGLDRYWSDYKRFTRLMTLVRKLEDARGLSRRLLNLRLYAAMLPFLSRKDWNAQRLMDSYFKDKKLQAVFISILADFFTPPSQFLGLGVFALNSETSFEKRMPKNLGGGAEQLYQYSLLGGSRGLVDALANKIRSLGGKIITGRGIRRIKVENNRVLGVIDEMGTLVMADRVIASGGVKETFLKLVEPERLPTDFVAHVREVALMDSVFMLHLGLDFDPSPHLHGVCTYVYGSYDVEGCIQKARAGVYHEGKDGFVVHVPSLHSPEMAPEGQHAMTIYTICPDRLKEGSWAERKEEYADKLIACAEERIPGLREHIRVRAVLTPEDFRQRTGLTQHAFGGIMPLMGAWKAPHQSPVEGLWFVGAQSESGGGVAAVMTAAYKTALKAVQPAS